MEARIAGRHCGSAAFVDHRAGFRLAATTSPTIIPKTARILA